jgi:hypothetical protein
MFSSCQDAFWVMLSTQVTTNEFQQQILPRIQITLASVEAKVHCERATIHDWEIDVEVGN